ncbi:MAG: hypothetical protein J7M14_00795, partial [Planctomycetes bacterium]|nr:hypothetical protein [Planctomycetota bacterium]
MTDAITLFEHHPTDDASYGTVAIDVSRFAELPISAMLYGKFCEHLGSNIYNGMEAQILRNPTFGDWPFGGSPERPPSGGYNIRTGVEAARAGGRASEAIIEAYEDGGAFFWYRVGTRRSVVLSPDVADLLRSQAQDAREFDRPASRAQRVEILDTSAGPAGIAQDTPLPLH